MSKMNLARRRDKRGRFLVVAAFVAAFVFAFLVAKNNNSNTMAANMAAFDPGFIMSDWQMGNYTSMNESQIQAFLKSKNSCYDTNLSKYTTGNKVGYFSEMSPPRTWHIKDGHFVCMADEVFDGGTAAHIIWQAAQDYHINPQVLLVLLEKEQSLVTDTFPHSQQYRSATGYGCPDTAPCSSQYYGLKNQIRKAAELFRTVLNGGWTNYPLGWNYVQYNPNTGCGGTMVNIRSLATSALYRYTPYQPNAAALGGWNDGCGAYGNMNFYKLFEDWFGGIKNETVSDEKDFVDGVYYIEQKNNTNKVLNVAGAQGAPGVNIELWDKKEELHQTWKIMHENNYYRIQDTYSGLFVDLYGTFTENGTNIQLWNWNDSCSQKWKIQETDDGYYRFVSLCSDKGVLDLRGGYLTNGTNIQLWEDDDSDAQKWRITSAATIAEGSYVLVAKKNGGMALDVNGAMKENGTNIQLWDHHRGGAQIWHISYDSESASYVLINPNSGKALDAAGASSDDGTNIQLWEKNSSCAQKWRIIQTLDGYYSLMSVCSNNKMLDMYGAGTRNGTNIQIWHNNLGDAQKWSIIPAGVVADGVYSIKTKLDDTKKLDIFGASTENGSNVQLWAGDQKWRITYNYDNGFYSVTNLGKALDAYGAYTQSGTNIQSWAQNQSCAQLWRILKTDDGYNLFINGCSQSYVLDVDDSSSINGANVRLWRSNGKDTQKWILQQ